MAGILFGRLARIWVQFSKTSTRHRNWETWTSSYQSLLKTKLRRPFMFTADFTVRLEIPEFSQSRLTEILVALATATKNSIWQCVHCIVSFPLGGSTGFEVC